MIKTSRTFKTLMMATAALSFASGAMAQDGTQDPTITPDPTTVVTAPADPTAPVVTPAPVDTPVVTPAPVDTPPPAPTVPDSVVVRQLSFAGTGCPAGSITGAFPTDPTSFYLALGSFTASAGNGAPITESRKNCQINLDLNYTAGWQYTVQSVEYVGHATMGDDATSATVGSSYYFQGDTATVRFATLISGPVDDDFDVTDSRNSRNEIWSSCDASRSLNLDLTAKVTSTNGNSQANGSVTFGSTTDGSEAGTLLTLKWRQCQ